MNDFTKDELEYLFRKFMLTNGDDFEHKLESKIQSMIENYCKHDGEIQKDYPAEKCMKCGAYWE